MTRAPIVIFIHGLNTYRDDLIHTGPLTFGPMWKYWKPTLEAAGYEFHSLNEMGYGLFEEQIDRAMKQIEGLLRSRGTDRPNIHLFGHSMGGLIARGVAKRIRAEIPDLAHVRSIITMGSPHFGSRAADGALDLKTKSPRLYRLLKAVGYDVADQARTEALSPLLIDKIREFNAAHPVIEGIECVSLVGAAPRSHIGYPYKFIYGMLHRPGFNEQSDGLVMSADQRWARIAGEFELDHMAQLGSFTYLSPLVKSHARRELERARKVIEDIIQTNSHGSK